jgi:hypothetical protein
MKKENVRARKVRDGNHFDSAPMISGAAFIKKLFGMTALMGCALSGFNANATPIGLAGDTIDAAVIRTIPDPFYGVGRVCCYGLDAPFQVADGNSDQKQYSGAFTLDVNNLSFDIDFLTQNGWQAGVVLRLSNLNFLPGQLVPFDLVLNSNLPGLTWSAGADFVDINLDSIQQTPNSYIHGQFQVPEPGTLLLIFLGLIGTWVIRNKRT